MKLYYICAVPFLIATVPSAHDVESVSFFAATTMDDVYLPLSLSLSLAQKKDFFALMEHASSSFRRKRELDQKIVKKEELAF